MHTDETRTSPWIILVDDHPVVRQGLALLLAQVGFTICGEAEDSASTMQLVESVFPNLVLVDLSLGHELGFDLIRALHERHILVLVYSMYEESAQIERAFAAGAYGYVTKRDPAGMLMHAIHEVLAGRRYMSERAAQSLASKLAGQFTNNQQTPIEFVLSEQEYRIYCRLGYGDNNTDIAARLQISVRTVESYCTRIIEKLDLTGMKALRQHAIQYSREHRSTLPPEAG